MKTNRLSALGSRLWVSFRNLQSAIRNRWALPLSILILISLASDLLPKSDSTQDKLARAVVAYGEENYQAARGNALEVIQSKGAQPDQRYFARYLLAFSYYFQEMKKADSLFQELAREIPSMPPDQKVNVKEWINDSFEIVWLDLFGKLKRQSDTVLDILVSTYLNRSVIYYNLETIKPIIMLTGNMFDIVDRRKLQKYSEAYQLIQSRQQEITKHLGSEIRK